jgi:hypothetical protein
MSLNIKNPETHELARELAALLHTTVTSAVTLALKEYIAIRKTGSQPVAKVERLRAISARATARMRATSGLNLHDVADGLYDARGLPL